MTIKTSFRTNTVIGGTPKTLGKIPHNIRFAQEETCRELPHHGGDHETRKYIAEQLINGARSGKTTLAELRAVARDALLTSTGRKSAYPTRGQKARGGRRFRSIACSQSERLALIREDFRASGQATWKSIFFQVGHPVRLAPKRLMRIEAKALTAINRRCVGEPQRPHQTDWFGVR